MSPFWIIVLHNWTVAERLNLRAMAETWAVADHSGRRVT